MPKITRHGGVSNRGAPPAAVPAPAEQPAEVMATEEIAGPAWVDYASWTRAELTAEARRRGLPTGGPKAGLAARLSAADAGREG